MSQSLTEVYRDRKGPFESYLHLYIGIALFSLGMVSIAVATVLATVSFSAFSLNEQWYTAGILGGVSVPLALMGVLAVFPAKNRNKSVFGGILLCFIGIGLFAFSFPNYWYGDTPSYAFHTVTTYSIGSIVLFSAVFSGVATFKARNDPGGTVSLKRRIIRKTRLSKEPGTKEKKGTGGVGFIGSTPTGNVETQTNSGQENTTVTAEK